MKLLIILVSLGTLVALTNGAPQERNPIDFLLDLNQDVLSDDRETDASVRPVSQAQVRTSTVAPQSTSGSPSNPAPVYEEEAEVQATVRPSGPPASQLKNEQQVRSEESVQNDTDEDEDDQQVVQPNQLKNEQQVRSEESVQNDTDEDDQQDVQQRTEDQEQSEDRKPESRNEDTTIRVYDPEDNNEQQQNDDQQNNGDQDQDLGQEKQPEQEQNLDDQQQRQQPAAAEFDIQPESDVQQERQEVVIPEIDQDSRVNQPNGENDVDVKPDQVFNHGTIVFDRTTFATGPSEDFSSTTPYSVKKWNHDHGPGFGEWPPKFGFSGPPPHGMRFDGIPPSGMRFGGPPPSGMRFNGIPPPWVHWHNHHHDHEDHERDQGNDEEYDPKKSTDNDHGPKDGDGRFYGHGFHGNGFHRGAPWRWH